MGLPRLFWDRVMTAICCLINIHKSSTAYKEAQKYVIIKLLVREYYLLDSLGTRILAATNYELKCVVDY